jgi:hypothetical protein
MENQVNSPKTVWKPEYVSSGSGLANNLKGTKVCLSHFFEGRVVQKNCTFTNAKDPITNSGAGVQHVSDET